MSDSPSSLHGVSQPLHSNNHNEPPVYLADFNYSIFNEKDTTIVASRVYDILKDSVDWSVAHHHTSYLDMVKIKYRTFQVEYPNYEDVCNLPSMFAAEFGCEMYKYNMLVDRYGNKFEVMAEKRNGRLCFTHGWSEIRNSYIDAEGKGMWVSLTYVRPKLFIVIIKDRYYRDVIVKHIYPGLSFALSRTVFGSDKNPGWADKLTLPYYHENANFKHNFVMILTISDVTTGFLTIYHGSFLTKILSIDTTSVRLIDDNGLEWSCSVDHISEPFNHFRIGGKWMSIIRARNYKEGNHIMFGSPTLGSASELFVKKIHE